MYMHIQSLLISWTVSNTNSLKTAEEKNLGVFFGVCYLQVQT